MLFPPQPSEPPEQRQQRERACHREALHDLVILGINTAKALERRAIASANEGTNAVIDAAIAFERIARAIRRTILLAEKLSDPTPPTAAPPKPDQPTNPPQDRPESYCPESYCPGSHRLETDPPNRQDRPESVKDEDQEDEPDEAQDHLPIPEQMAAIHQEIEAVQPVAQEKPSPPGRRLGERNSATPTHYPQTCSPNTHPRTIGPYFVGPPEKKPRAKPTRKPPG